MGAGAVHEGSPLARLLAALGRLGCSPSEAAALALLGAAALAGLGLLWWAGRPADQPGEAIPVDVGSGEAGAGAHDGDGEGSGFEIQQSAVVVHVAGRVHTPGLYELPGGSRVADALAAAGGPLDDALLDHLNLARPLSDGEQLRVPGPDDVAAPAAPGIDGGGAGGGDPGAVPGGAGPTAWRPDGTLDLNLATQADLEELPGIGPVLAERIVAYRDAQGGFTAVGELRSVEGIGERTFQRLADLVAL